MPIAPLVEGGRLAGLRFVRTQVEDGAAAPTPGTEIDVYAPLVISSIGSIPEPLPGIQMKHEYYCFKDSDTGEYAAAEGVFGLGNVVTIYTADPSLSLFSRVVSARDVPREMGAP